MGSGPKRISGKIVATFVVAVIVIGTAIAIFVRWQGGEQSLEPFRAGSSPTEPQPAP